MLPSDVATKLSECAKTDFVGMKDWWFRVVSWATALVALGLVLEAPELVHDLIPIGRKIIARLKKSSIEFPKHEVPDWVKVVAFIGWILIVVGVVGEEFAGIKVNDLDANIQECSDAKVQAATLEAGDAATSAKNAHDEADAVAKRADELTRQLARSKTQLDAVDAKRAELEKSLINLAVCNSPRVIPAEGVFMVNKLTSTADPLRPFAREVSIEYVRDAEARRAALNLFLALAGVGWKVTMVPRDEIRTADGIEVEPFDDGVEVEYFMAPSFAVPPWEASFADMWEEELDSWNAAEAVVDFLHSYDWQARIGWPVNEKGEEIRDPKIFPPRSLRIKVGLYPAVIYVSPSGAKAFAEAYKQFEQENDKMLAQIRPQETEAEKRLLAQLTPKQAAVFKARKDHLAKMRKQREEQFSGPCQPLIPNPFPQHP